ncbi:MAG: BcsE family c-di-GMP-binding protein, partial [Pseudomonas sp.]
MPLLAISGLGAEGSQLHAHGLYWLACDTAEDATVLCRQVLEGLSDRARAALIAEAQAMADVLAALDAAHG